jgi:hypothetical protein
MARRPVTKTLAVPALVAAGAAQDISQIFEFDGWVTVTGTFVATLQVQLSNDGVTWAQDGANISAPIVQKVSGRAKFIRINTSAFTSGVPAASHYGIETLPEV